MLVMKVEFTYSQFLDLLQSDKTNDAYVIEQLIKYEGEDVRLLGAKTFIEIKPSISALKSFINLEHLEVKRAWISVHTYKIAASILLLLTLGFFLNRLLGKQKDASAYMTSENGYKVWMNSPQGSINLLNGMSYYKDKKYDQALAHFVSSPRNDTALFFCGLCYLHLNQFEKAESALIKVSELSIYRSKSIYYTSLCYLFTGRIEKGLKNLTTLSFKESALETKRKELLIDFTK